MSSKRQPSKQRRQSQNRQQRAALQARKEAAAAQAAEEAADSSRGSSSGGGFLSRLRGGGSAGAPPARSTSAAPARGRTPGVLPVGHRAALTAVIAAVAGAIVGSLLFKVPMDRAGEPISSTNGLVAEWAISADGAVQSAPADADAAQIVAAVDDWSPGGSEPYGQAYFPRSLTIVLPVIGAAVGFFAVSRGAGSKVVNRTMYVTLFGTLLTFGLALVFFPAVISLAVAAFQVRKHEMATLAAGGGPTGVIDVAEVDADDEHDELEDATSDGDAVDDAEEDLDEADDDAVAPERPQSVLGRLRRPDR